MADKDIAYTVTEAITRPVVGDAVAIVITGDWLLDTGFWDDTGVWDDSETWND